LEKQTIVTAKTKKRAKRPVAAKTRKKKNAAETLIARIKSRKVNVGVIGLGYVGLPLSVELAKSNFKVTGFDISAAKIQLLNSGKSDIDDIHDSEVHEIISSGNFLATADESLISKMDVVMICVPTPLSKTKDPDSINYVFRHMAVNITG